MTTNENHLIELLPERDREQLLAACESVPLLMADLLCERGEPARHAFFPNEGFITLVSQVDKHPGLEVGMVGREGMIGAQIALGIETAPLRAQVQGAGRAWRIGCDDLRRQLHGSAALRSSLHRFVHVRMAQLAISAACLRFHLISPRLARWLLMSQDRAQADSFHVTQEFLAHMLGVRRVGVTVAAGMLQSSGLIRYHRGEMTVLDRSGLEAAACSCYAADRLAYSEWLG